MPERLSLGPGGNFSRTLRLSCIDIVAKLLSHLQAMQIQVVCNASSRISLITFLIRDDCLLSRRRITGVKTGRVSALFIVTHATLSSVLLD